MLLRRNPLVPFLYAIICVHGITCDDPTVAKDADAPNGGDIDSALTKFDYSRYGKRPAGHSFVRFGKRDENRKGHSFLYFGKRSSPEERNFAELLQYLQRNQDPSWKRGHSIMRFGKRAPEKHNFIRFGKREDMSDDVSDDVEKRGGHSMMYFGKRNGHSMMYFGKRDPSEMDDVDKRNGHSMMYFGKRLYPEDDIDKKGGHSMMYFGKRLSDDDEVDKKGGHSMMYFGKRFYPGDDIEKKGGHSMMYFGKRLYPDDDMDKKGGHSMMYFGKRLQADDDEGDIEKKGGHSMMYFGKRDESENDDLEKRGGHSMMYFGKRAYPDDDSGKRTGHSMMYFGKRDSAADGQNDSFQYPASLDDSGEFNEDKRASHSMLRFGKRQVYGVDGAWIHSSGPFDPIANHYYTPIGSNGKPIRRATIVDKKKHNMMHFGKRSVDGDYEESAAEEGAKSDAASQDSKSETAKSPKHDRKKREVETSAAPMLSFPPYIPVYDTDAHPDGYDYSEDSFYGPDHINSLVPLKERRSTDELEKSKNVFLRFGKH